MGIAVCLALPGPLLVLSGAGRIFEIVKRARFAPLKPVNNRFPYVKLPKLVR